MVLPTFLHGRAALSLANVLSCAARLGSARRFEESLPLPPHWGVPKRQLFLPYRVCRMHSAHRQAVSLLQPGYVSESGVCREEQNFPVPARALALSNF